VSGLPSEGESLRIVASDPGDLARPAVAALRSAGRAVEVLPAGLSPDDVADRASDADVLLAGIVPLPASAIDRLRGVRLIVRCGAGVDSVDVAAATARRIWVANVPDYCIEEVADHTLLLLLAASRHLEVFRAQVGTRPWTELEYPPVRRLAGRTLGLVGFGRIGARVAMRARGFGLRILVHDPWAPADRIREAGAEPVGFDDLLAASHLLSLHVPLTRATHHLMSHEAFARMPGGSVLVNTSRGALVDLDALEWALSAGIVAAAGLDVRDGEPGPDLSHPLLHRPEVLVTPHVAFYSVDSQAELGRRVAEEVGRFSAGMAPASLVNPTARASVD
jgi:D-3-phosphoglycerate dehydrogenase / 2-oxoglutarate reductase